MIFIHGGIYKIDGFSLVEIRVGNAFLPTGTNNVVTNNLPTLPGFFCCLNAND